MLKKIARQLLAVAGLASALLVSTTAEANTIIAGGTILHSGDWRVSTNNRYKLTMQADGNLVLYRTVDNTAVWNASTFGAGNYAYMQTDGNLVVYNSAGTYIWTTWTGQNPGAFLDLQDDGNLVVYSPTGTALWNTQTGNAVIANMTFADANFRACVRNGSMLIKLRSLPALTRTSIPLMEYSPLNYSIL
jgi:exopolysaccharide biosynthesis protein